MQQRGCDICGSLGRRAIHEQTFAPLDDGSTFTGYEVVICSDCGYGYADGIPPQEFYDRYYRDMSKYGPFQPGNPVDATHSNYTGRRKNSLVALSRPLDPHTRHRHRIGAYARRPQERRVSKFARHGSSPQCASEVMQRYGVRVVATPISQMAFEGQRFDLVLLTSVIEHLRDAIVSLEGAAALLAPGGAIFIDAPDASRFADFVAAPFQQFSLEHINYFTASSLENAFSRIDFSPVDIWTDVRHDGPVKEAVISGLFRRATAARKIKRDEVAESALRAYVDASRRVETDLTRKIQPLRAQRSPVIIWGVGTLTLRLLATGAFKDLDVVAFVDSNKNYQGKRVGGLPILAPSALQGRSETILVSSRAHQAAIARQIRNELALPNPVVTLFSECD